MRCDLEGAVAFVTGAGGAIGAAIAARLSQSGAAVIVADINAESARRVSLALPRSMASTVDISSQDSVNAAVAGTIERFGRLDILVNNAGVNTLNHRVNIDNFPKDEWDRIVRIDLDGLYLMSRAALGPMLAGGRGGRVVNIASVVGLAAMRLQSPFVAAKAAVVHLTRAMALELGPQGILTNAVAPGSVLSEATRKLFYSENGSFTSKTESFMRHIPLGRPGLPEEIAEVVLFFCSPDSSYINGQVLAVDGGWTAGYTM